MNKKVILSGILSLVLCVSIIAGGTFALFTSEAQANIAITAGNVEVTASISDIVTSTFGTVQAEGTFELGGTASYDSAENKLTVDKMAPGDRVDLKVNVENLSNITASYRVKVAFFGELQNALVANVTLPGNEKATVLTSADVATAWNSFDDTNQVVIPMSIELPYTTGNAYKNKSAEIVITIEAVQENATDLVMIGDTMYATLPEAIAAAKDGDTISLSGVYTLPTDGTLKNRELTFKAIEDSTAVFDLKKFASGQNTSGASLTFDGCDVVFDNNANYQGIQHAAKVVYKNCTITGQQTMYAGVVEFTQCNLVNYTSYCVWTYGTDATFTKCTFTTGGKAILVYNEGTTDDTVTVTDCTFTGNGQCATDKAAVETGINTAASKHTLIITGTTATGFAANKSTSPLWGNKNSMDTDHLTVIIDGVDVYTSTNYDDGEEHTIDLSQTEFAVTGNELQDKGYAAVKVNSESSVTISGQGAIDVAVDSGVSTAIAVWARNGGDVVIEDGTYTLTRAQDNFNELELIYASDTVLDGNTTTITIKGGTFKCDNPCKTLNIHGSGAGNDAEAFIYVMGGSFWEFNPAADFTGLGTTDGGPEDDNIIVPEGYTVISEEKADGTWYTVVAE